MGSFEKAVSRVEKLAMRGGYPAEVVLTHYPSRAAFGLHHPSESYDEHLSERSKLVEWLTAKSIKVIDDTVDAPIPTKGSELAEHAVRRQPWGMKKGDPYRLGLSIGSGRGYSGLGTISAIGWMVLPLGSSKKGDE